MKNKIIIILLIFKSTFLFSDEFFKIEKQKIKVKKIHHHQGDKIFITLKNHLTVKSSNNNIYKIYKKDETPLDYNHKYDLVCSKKTGAVIEFISRKNSKINNVIIPEGVKVNLKHSSIAWIVDNEIQVTGINLVSLHGIKKVNYKGIIFDVHSNKNKTFKMNYNTIQGMLSRLPLKKYNCLWENGGDGKHYGVKLSMDGDIISAKLSKGSIYGFSEKLIYIFHKSISNSIPILKQIVDKNNEQYYGSSPMDQEIRISKAIKWNNIPLSTGDKLYIFNPYDKKIKKDEEFSYKLNFIRPKNISSSNNRNIEVTTKKSPLFYYANLKPESFVLNKSFRFKNKNKFYNLKKLSKIILYKNGLLKSIIHKGKIYTKIKGQYFIFSNDLHFHKNGNIKEGVLAKEKKINIWGKKVTLQRNTRIHFKEDSTLESATTEGNKGKTIIYYLPQFEKK